eukprot:97144_1
MQSELSLKDSVYFNAIGQRHEHLVYGYVRENTSSFNLLLNDKMIPSTISKICFSFYYHPKSVKTEFTQKLGYKISHKSRPTPDDISQSGIIPNAYIDYMFNNENEDSLVDTEKKHKHQKQVSRQELVEQLIVKTNQR